jgi:tetraacyldisaccharide 4'-kinase
MNNTFSQWLEREWYQPSPWQFLLFPLSILFGLLAGVRRLAYRLGWLSSVRLPVPVVVIGNISVGGTGKTPLVLWLVKRLAEQGFRPGIVSRGYGGKGDQVVAVHPDSDPALMGDEPVLLARKSGCPVWVGRDRPAAAEALLRAHPQCDVLVSDDGLQHYRLARDVEIVVVDGERGFGNGRLLPAGPLREGIGRLATADAVVVNGGAGAVPIGTRFGMRLRGDLFYNLPEPQRLAAAADFRGKRLHAVAGIGNPRRFFDSLRSEGLAFEEHAFPDHHDFRPEDLAFDGADAVLMTEKDAVKCAGFATEHHWALAVEAEVDPGLDEKILEKIRKKYGSQAA